jgi:hypothetical protein
LKDFTGLTSPQNGRKVHRMQLPESRLRTATAPVCAVLGGKTLPNALG